MAEKKRRGQRPDGLIQVTYTDGRNADGSPHRLSFYGSTRAEAEKKREDYKARSRAGISPQQLTVNQWLDIWVDTYAINTDIYRYYIDRVREDIGRMQLDAVRESDLVQSLRNNFQGHSASGATKYRMILQQIFKKARINRHITYDPAEDLQLPKTATPTGHRALEKWETDLILKNWQQHRAGLWAMIMLLAGLRRGELMALTWENIDLTARTLTVCQTAVIKSNAAIIEPRAKTLAGMRTVPLCNALKTALESVPPPLRTGLVCTTIKRTPLTATGFDRGWEGFNAAMSRIHAGLDPDQRGRRSDLVGAPPSSFSVRPHDLRHTFCTMLYDAQIDVKTASYLMGHSDTRVTLETYTHISAQRKQQTAAALVGLLDNFTQ